MGDFATAELFFCSSNHDWSAWVSKLESDRHIVKLHFFDVDTHNVNEHSPGCSLQAAL